MEEIWKDVVGYEGLYMISNKGNVKTYAKLPKVDSRGRVGKGVKQKLLSLCIGKQGYSLCCLSKNKSAKTMSCHRVVAMAFLPNPDNKPQVNHINSIRTDNNVENLEWCTAKENSIHCMNAGRNPTTDSKRQISGKRESNIIFDEICGIYYNSSKEASAILGYSISTFFRLVKSGKHRYKYV